MLINHVFKRRAVEKELSTVHDVAGLTKISSQSFVKVVIMSSYSFQCFKRQLYHLLDITANIASA